MKDWMPEKDLGRFVVETVEEFDLTRFVSECGGTGSASYHPELMTKHGFNTEFFGGSPVDASGLKSGVLQLAKKIAVSFNLIPGSMRSKRLLKRLVFGRLVSMPRELRVGDARYAAPVPIDGRWLDTVHKVLYCVVKLR